ncbi:MAG: 16S rRNA (cytidine(1402)-2'-O)-methyltransferase [Magnetococcales bacterium]|nr:16S rRNA (cytidine(1402)-2'-O)-methyltransferase [Magnetococcales bacterium]
MALGELYIVPTPIGNLEDMTYRGVRVLAEVERILAEDTRTSRILCERYGITTPLMSFNDHNARQRLPKILAELGQGISMALISDAGTPGISDPGLPLVQEAIAQGIQVTVLPGASAVTTAVAGSGLGQGGFLFEGFLPKKAKARQDLLSGLSEESRLLLFFESPKRIAATLKDIARVMGEERRVVVARELSKIHETWHRGSAGELEKFFSQNPPRGEMVVVVEGATPREASPEEITAWLKEALAEGLGSKLAARKVSARSGVSSTALYRKALAIQKEN